MSIIETGERIAKELDEAIGSKIISAVVYGEDIQKEEGEDKDCSLLIVLEKVDLPTMEILNEKLEELGVDCLKSPLVIEMGEIEGMTDSVPPTFLNIMISYQTVYGSSLFKGLSSINHEHLRAQTEQSLREDLFCARHKFLKGLRSEEEMRRTAGEIRDTFKRSLKLYYLVKKPWITDLKEKWETFLKDFNVEDPWITRSREMDLSKAGIDDLKKISSALIDNGLKPLLDKVDKMGP
ncbi:MAG: hypothetical protein R6V01_01220 [Thermoplasmatota archaeon]